ncbi:Uncharacterised protein [Enterobacter cloacae]|nr:Uncharacterised protein [Enterobacter cloacae]
MTTKREFARLADGYPPIGRLHDHGVIIHQRNHRKRHPEKACCQPRKTIKRGVIVDLKQTGLAQSIHALRFIHGNLRCLHNVS